MVEEDQDKQYNKIKVSYMGNYSYELSGEDIFKYNKPQFVISNMFESNLAKAKEKGWNKVILSNPKFDFIKQMNPQQVQQFLKNKLISAVMDEKRVLAFNKLYEDTVYKDNVNYEDSKVINITNKYLLAKILKDENVNLSKLEDWSKNNIDKALMFNAKLQEAIDTSKVTKNKDGTYLGLYTKYPDRSVAFKDIDKVTKRTQNYFNRMNNFVATLENIGIMNEYKKNIMVLDKKQTFIKEQLVNLINDKKAMVNKDTLKIAYNIGVTNTKRYKQSEINKNQSTSMDKIKQDYQNKNNQQASNKSDKSQEEQIVQEQLKTSSKTRVKR